MELQGFDELVASYMAAKTRLEQLRLSGAERVEIEQICEEIDTFVNRMVAAHYITLKGAMERFYSETL